MKRSSGAGPPLLLLHGFPHTCVMWRKTAPALAGRFAVAAPGLRGHGGSERVAGPLAEAP